MKIVSRDQWSEVKPLTVEEDWMLKIARTANDLSRFLLEIGRH
jgi:acyl carrier protein